MTTAIVAAAFVACAAIAALGRSWMLEVLNRERFPFGTLTVNVTGSFVAGILAGRLDGSWATILTVAALGSFTTFSTFANEVIALWSPQRALSILYAALTTVGAIGAAFIALGV